MIEVVQQPVIPIGLLMFAIGLTAITFIAIIVYLDVPHKHEPLQLPWQQN